MADGGDKLGSYAFDLDGESYEVDVVYQGVPGAGGQQDVGGAKSLPKWNNPAPPDEPPAGT